jgi:hypothetical protein
MNNDASRAQLLTMARLLTDNLSNFLKAVKGSTMGEASSRTEMSRYSDAAAKALGLLLQQVNFHSGYKKKNPKFLFQKKKKLFFVLCC